jgi:hypothetical protein
MDHVIAGRGTTRRLADGSGANLGAAAGRRPARRLTGLSADQLVIARSANLSRAEQGQAPQS